MYSGYVVLRCATASGRKQCTSCWGSGQVVHDASARRARGSVHARFGGCLSGASPSPRGDRGGAEVSPDGLIRATVGDVGGMWICRNVRRVCSFNALTDLYLPVLTSECE